MDNVLTLDAETAAELDCKPGETKTVEIEITVDKNDAQGLSAKVLSVSHYENKEEPNETMEEGEAVAGSAIPASNSYKKSTPKAVKNLMTKP